MTFIRIFITARIRRMREGNSFSLFVSPHPEGGGGVPHLHPIILQLVPRPSQGGTKMTGPRSIPGSTLARSRQGGTLARSRQGVPRMGSPHPGMGIYPLGRDTVPPGMGYSPSPRIGQHMEYLIRGGLYVSCIQVGGLSCMNMIFII